MLFIKGVKDYILAKKDLILYNKNFTTYPLAFPLLISILDSLYLLALCICLNTGYENIILPLIKKNIYIF